MNENILLLLKDCEKSMGNSTKDLNVILQKIYIHKIDINTINCVKIKYKDSMTFIKFLAKIEIKTPINICITPYDHNSIQTIYKQILDKFTFLNININEKKILMKLPLPTTSQRLIISKNIKKISEEKKIQIRNIRRIFNLKIKKYVKINKKSVEDEKKSIKIIQNMTDKNIKIIDSVLLKKLKYINTV